MKPNFCLLAGILLLSSQIVFSQTGEWTWMHGDTTYSSLGVYGTQGVSSPLNKPPALEDAACWTDLNGNFWLFGGNNYPGGVYCDLWFYNVALNEWTWMKGPGLAYHFGFYGTQGIADPLNYPGSRAGCLTWVDNQGDLWLLGGGGYEGPLTGGVRNDLWRYHIATNEWTWMKGPQIFDDPGFFGTMNISGPLNNPPCRANSCTWVDDLGRFWLFGGWGAGAPYLFKNDVWMYDPAINEWTWIKGTSNPNQPMNYGIKGVETPLNDPGSRIVSFSWKDKNGYLWFYAGQHQMYGVYSDVWRFNIQTRNWTWMSGPSSNYIDPVNQANCLASPGNKPGSRWANQGSWQICDLVLTYGGIKDLYHNWAYSDLWQYNAYSDEWIALSGDQAVNKLPVYGTNTVSSPGNSPGARGSYCSWKDLNGNLWLFGGYRRYPACGDCTKNDLWRFVVDSNCCNIPNNFSITVDTVICKGDSISLSISAVSTYTGFTYSWSPGAGLNDSTLQHPLAAPDTTTLYTATVYYFGCSKEKSVLVEVDEVHPALSQDTAICKGDTIQLFTSGNSVQQWFPNQFIINADGSSPYVYPDSSMYYYVNVSDSNNCRGRDSVFVSVLNLPVANAGNDTLVCRWSVINLEASGGQTYHWSTGETTAGIIISCADTVTYFITVSDSFNCSSPDSIKIGLLPSPMVTSSHDTSICAGKSVVLYAYGADHYTWDPDDYLTNTTASVVTSMPVKTITYYVIGFNGFNCADTAEVNVQLTICEPVIPNVFTPNQDSKNDYYSVLYYGAEAFSINIFNRWGQLIYQSNDIQKNWDGKCKGQDVSEGVYFYQITIGQQNYNGSVTLLR